MADLIPEDGTGVANSDTFGSVVEFDEYLLDYFGAASGAVEASAAAALRRAFVYMSALRWKTGTWVTFGGSIPLAVVRAQFTFARAELRSVGVLSPSVAAQPNKILTRAGDLSWSPNTTESSVEESRTIVTMGFDLLAPYLESNPARDKGDGLYLLSIGK